MKGYCSNSDRLYIRPDRIDVGEHNCSVPNTSFPYVTCDRPKEAFMGGHPFPEIPCKLCAKAVDLTVDLSADENGKAVHEDCYVEHITGSRRNPPTTMMTD